MMETNKASKTTFCSGVLKKCKRIVYILVCLPSMFTGIQMMASVFVLFIPKHRCSIPTISNDTFEVQGKLHQTRINETIPLLDGDTVYSQCEMFKISINTSYSDWNIPVNTSTEQCNKWVYDRSGMKETFITKASLVCMHEIARANANMIFSSGVTSGALVTGILADMFGRKKVLILCIFLQIGGAFGSAIVSDFILFVIMRFLVGFSTIGMYSSSFVIGIELVSPSKRVAVSFALDVAWCVGLYILCFLAYFIRVWNMVLLATASLSLLLLACLWLIPESPRWLKSKGRINDANDILEEWANVKGKQVKEDSSKDDLTDDNATESIQKMFKIPKLLMRTFLIYFNWFVIIMVTYGISLNVGNLDGDLFANFAMISSMEVLAYTLCFLMLNRFGRKVLLIGALVVCGIACILTVFTVWYLDKSLYWITLVLFYIGKLGISASHSIVYVWSAELFPTRIRNSGVGTSIVVGFGGSMISPYISDMGKFVNSSFGKILPQTIFGSLSIVAGLTSLLLPETNGKQLPETVLDAVHFGEDIPGNETIQTSIFHVNDAFCDDKPAETKS